MKIFSVTILFLFCYSISYPQLINIKLDNLNQNTAILSSLEGEKVSVYDTIVSLDKREFQFNLEKNNCGIYRISFGNNKWMDFIYDNENVEIETDTNNFLDSLKVIKSESNKIYYNFVKLNKAYKTKTELLQLMLARYPKEDDYFRTTKEKLIKVQEEYYYYVNMTSQVNPTSFIARYVRSAQLPVIDVKNLSDETLIFLKIHALDNVNFKYDSLIYSDAITNKTIEYLTYYRNPQLPKELLGKEFESAIDTILGKAKVNEIVYKHIVEYMLDGFKKFEFDNVINYILENYVIKDDLCLDEKLGNTLEKRIEQARNFKVGNLVPNIALLDSSSKLIELNKINADSVLIIFYASWCSHCQALLPQIYDLYKNQAEKKFEVLAISIDTSRSDWLNFIKTIKSNWIDVSDLKGWNGRAATEYYLYATPTMFLVDKELKLIAEFSSIDELHKWF